MPTTVLYRISSGEVVKISNKGQTFADRNTAYWGVLVDPSMPDGSECRDANYELRVLGYAKINDAGTVRNAIQGEIDTFEALEDDDENNQDADAAIDLFENHPRFRKMQIAFADIIKDEFNILRQWLMQYKADVAAANNLAALKASVAALPDLPDRTLAQLKSAIRNRVSKDG